MPKGKRKAKEVEEEDELVVVKENEKEEEQKEEKKDKKKDDDEGDGEDGVGEKERMKLIKARRKQMLDDIRDEQNKSVAAAQERSARDRLQFLLQQSEIYTHFMKPDAGKKGGKGSAKNAASPARRTGRITEKEEDDMLLQEAKTDAPAVQLTSTPPFIKHAPMRDYQVAGLNWLVRLHDSGINGILADEMGLGKTLQTISFLGYLKHVRGINGPHLVVTPKSTLGNWLNEVQRWCPSLRAIKLHGTQEERAEQKANLMIPGEFDILITTYEIAIKEKAAISKFHYRYIVVDEAHRIKNEQSVLSQVVRLYKVQNRLLLTGTPLQNNLHELWALLNFLLPEVFSSAEDFDSWFDLQGEGDKQEVVEKLHMVLRPFLLRRLKVDVEKSLPPKKEIKLFVGLSELQKVWYKKVLLRDIEAVNGGGGEGKGSRVRLLNIVMQLRKAANHPYLFDGAEPYPFETGEHLVTSSGKLVVLDKLLPKLQAQGSRVLIFSQMTRLLDILEDYMIMRKWQYCRIDGSTAGSDRESQIDEFNKPGSKKFIFLLSTRAGGLGINLATADTVVLYDSDWNPQVDLQAQDRAHRIGQKKQVNVYRFVTEGTIEEKVVERAEMKLQLDALVIQQGRLVEQNRALSKDELLGMIKFGADQIFSSTGGTITDEDIDAILARGQQKTDEINAKLKTNVQRRLLDFSLDGGGSLYSFEGVDYSGGAGKNKLLDGWIEPPKRERKTQGYGVNEYYRNALRIGEPRKQGPPRPPKQPVIHDFQFYPPQLQALLDKETAAFRKRLEWTKAKEEREKEEAEKKEKDGGTAAAGAAAADEKEPDFGELTPEEEAAKAKMLGQGLSTWTRRDFNAFVRGCEHYGRKDYSNIAKECERTIEDVKQYAHIFWSRGPKQIADWEKLVKRIEDGEGRIQRRGEMSAALDIKVARYKNPWEALKLNYGMKRGKQYIEEEDVFLVCMTQKLGYGNWDALKVEIRKAWQFRFNWFLKSRSPLELQRRVDTLIRLIEKENEEIEKKGGKVKKAKPADGAAGIGKKRGPKEEKESAKAGGLSKRRKVPVTHAADAK